MIALIVSVLLSGCTATDGDTIRCGAERIRLTGIDAPEFHCPSRRRCAPGSARASAANMARMIRGRRLDVHRIGRDRYGRTLAIVRASGVNLACAQLAGGYAIYRADWDDGDRVRRACR